MLSPGDGLHLPYWLFNFEEIGRDRARVGSQRPSRSKILGEAVLAAKRSYFAKVGLDSGTVDTPVPYRMSDVLRHLDAAMGASTGRTNVAAYQVVRPAAAGAAGRRPLRLCVRQPLDGARRDVGILSQLFRIPVDGKPITILDLSGIPSEVLNVVVSVLCRLTFDFALWSETPVPITIVCEEAHRYAPRDKELGFEPAKRALSRIAKEGRKYGVSLCVVTQRPSDLAPGLLSECNTIFALRMTTTTTRTSCAGARARSLARADEFPAGAAQRRGDRRRRRRVDADAHLLRPVCRRIAGRRAPPPRSPAPGRRRATARRSSRRSSAGAAGHALRTSGAYRPAILLADGLAAGGGSGHISRRVPATPAPRQTHDPGNQKLPGGSQPPARHRRALALQREGDLPARTDLERLGCLRPAALCGADRARLWPRAMPNTGSC